MNSRTRHWSLPRRTARAQWARGLALLAALVVAVAVVAGCGGDDAASNNDSLTVAVLQEPDSLDPGAASLVTSYQINQSIFDPLMYEFPAEHPGKYFPGLATSFTASDDATVYTFELRKGVKFQDGTPFNADAVKTTFDHIVDPATQSGNPRSLLGPYKETRVINDYKVKVIFKRPNASFADEMTGPAFGISSPTALKKYGEDYGHHPVGTGPFKFKEWVTGQHVTLERNPDYDWGPRPVGNSRPPFMDELVYRILPDPASQSNALQTGELDIAQNLTAQDVDRLLKDDRFTDWTTDGQGLPYVVDINVDKAPTDDLRVRQALNYATDQQAIIDTVFSGLYKPAVSVFDPPTPGYDAKSQDLYPYDPDRAEKLLDEAGWQMGSDGIRERDGAPLNLKMLNIADEGFDGIAQVLQSQLKEVGVNVTIDAQGFPGVGESYKKGVHNLGDHWNWGASPYYLANIFGCDYVEAGFNWTHYCNRAMERRIEQANATMDAKRRNELWAEIGATLMADAPVIPIYDKRVVLVGSADFEGVTFSGVGIPMFGAVRVHE